MSSQLKDPAKRHPNGRTSRETSDGIVRTQNHTSLVVVSSLPELKNSQWNEATTALRAFAIREFTATRHQSLCVISRFKVVTYCLDHFVSAAKIKKAVSFLIIRLPRRGKA